MKQIIDSRGYVGGERNRALTPEQVVWARKAAFEQKATAAAIRDALRAVGIDMSVDSVRRMLRGETYGNVGVQLPRTEIQAPTGEVPELVKVTDEEVAASGARLLELLKQPVAEPRQPADPADIMRKLGEAVAAERAAGGDALVAELQGIDPFAPGGEAKP